MTRDEVLRILADHRAELEEHAVKHLSLFGSVARDEAGSASDVDVLVEFNKPVGLFALVGLQDYLDELLGRPVDLGTASSLKARLRAKVLKEAVPVI